MSASIDMPKRARRQLSHSRYFHLSKLTQFKTFIYHLPNDTFHSPIVHFSIEENIYNHATVNTASSEEEQEVHTVHVHAVDVRSQLLKHQAFNIRSLRVSTNSRVVRLVF